MLPRNTAEMSRWTTVWLQLACVGWVPEWSHYRHRKVTFCVTL